MRCEKAGCGCVLCACCRFAPRDLRALACGWLLAVLLRTGCGRQWRHGAVEGCRGRQQERALAVRPLTQSKAMHSIHPRQLGGGSRRLSTRSASAVAPAIVLCISRPDVRWLQPCSLHVLWLSPLSRPHCVLAALARRLLPECCRHEQLPHHRCELHSAVCCRPQKHAVTARLVRAQRTAANSSPLSLPKQRAAPPTRPPPPPPHCPVASSFVRRLYSLAPPCRH
jgi:hypothetical protein